MAKSPAHRFGQIIGDMLETAMVEYCFPIAQNHRLYLDYRHPRIARNNQSEVRWIDINGNTHKLDIVMEANGTDNDFGYPRAFIEIAWRRYTKHSKNKAQEISAAITPLINKYHKNCPFFGAILAGDFTNNSLMQLKSEGFHVLYFSLENIRTAFMAVNIDAYWEETTSESELQSRVEQFDALSETEVNLLKSKLTEINKISLDKFVSELETSLLRRVDNIRIFSMFGAISDFSTIDDACRFLSGQIISNIKNEAEFCYYEVYVTYSNGDRIEMKYKEEQSAIVALKSLL